MLSNQELEIAPSRLLSGGQALGRRIVESKSADCGGFRKVGAALEHSDNVVLRCATRSPADHVRLREYLNPSSVY